MKYEPLYKTYYGSRKEYTALYESRFDSADTVRSGIDISGHEAFYVPCEDIFTLSGNILRTDKQVSLLSSRLPAQAIHQFRTDSLVDEIVITNRIEGVSSTRKEIRDVMDSLGKSGRREKRFEGLINQYILLGERDLELSSPEDIRSLYDELVLEEVVRNDPSNAPDGRIFRKNAVSVRNPAQKIIHTGVSPEEKIIEYMQKSLDILNDEDTDILLRTAVFHYLFGYIHPFYDGNGRLSRFISSYCLSWDLDPLLASRLSYTIQDNINEYYRSFRICNDPVNKGDMTPFIISFLGIVLKAEENLLYALSKRAALYDGGLDDIRRLSSAEGWDRNTEALCHALLISSLFTKDGMSKKELLSEVGIRSNTTLNTKLHNLRKYDLVIETRDGNTLYYGLDHDKLHERSGK